MDYYSYYLAYRQKISIDVGWNISMVILWNQFSLDKLHKENFILQNHMPFVWNWDIFMYLALYNIPSAWEGSVQKYHILLI